MNCKNGHELTNGNRLLRFQGEVLIRVECKTCRTISHRKANKKYQSKPDVKAHRTEKQRNRRHNAKPDIP